MKSDLFLSFYGDGPYWRDFLHLLAYPSKTNYIWPFRYAPKYIHSSLREIAEDARRSRSLLGKLATIGTRLQDVDGKNVFIPIRHAIIRDVEFVAGVFQFHFFLDNHFDFRSAKSLSALQLHVKVPHDYLAFTEERVTSFPQTCPQSDEGANWNAFSLLVAREDKLRVNQSAARGLWINVAPRSCGARFGIQKSGDLWCKRTRADRSLFMFPGEILEMDYAHHVPFLGGTNTTLDAIEIDIDIDSDDFEISTVGARPIGNYGVQKFSLAALRPTKISHKISFKFKSRRLPSQDGRHEISTTNYELPVYIRWSFFFWLKSSVLPVLALFISLIVLGLAGIIEKNIAKIIDGSLRLSDLSDFWIISLFVVVASASATFAIPFFRGPTK